MTLPERRGEGHGSRLYESVEGRLREAGCQTVVLASGKDRERTHDFYREHGFEVTEYWFEKSLASGDVD